MGDEMRDDPTVIDLVNRARAGDSVAWNEMVDRYSGMMWRVCRGLGLNEADAHDVGQTVWLQLYRELDKIRQPAALPGWLLITTRRECYRIQREHARELPETAIVEQRLPPDDTPPDQEILLEERRTALHTAFADLPVECQDALTLLMQVPPLTYAEVGAKLGLKVGGLGPRRGRCLNKLRTHPAVAALIDDARCGTR
jgi:RNA polymerase sigma factor (sigma-70 family)